MRSEDFLAIVRAMDEEGDLEREHEMEPITPSPSTKDAVRKEGLIVFFPGFCLFSTSSNWCFATSYFFSFLT